MFRSSRILLLSVLLLALAVSLAFSYDLSKVNVNACEHRAEDHGALAPGSPAGAL